MIGVHVIIKLYMDGVYLYVYILLTAYDLLLLLLVADALCG